MSRRGAVDVRLAEKRPLTSIRGIASLWVVAHHWLPITSPFLWMVLTPGFTAVDLFFVLSGLILARVHPDLRPRGLGQFYLRRVCRLYPLHLFCLAWLVCFEMQTHRLTSLDWLGLAAAGSLMAPFLDLQTINNPPAWSIGVELGCYLVFPLLLTGLQWAAARRRGASRLAVSAIILVALLWVEWRVECRVLGATHGAAAMLRGLSGFALGMAISVCCQPLWPGVGRRGWLLGAGLELVGLAGLVFAFPTARWQIMAPCSAVLLAGLAFDRGPVAWLLRGEVWHWLGRISFSIYLVHYPLLVGAKAVLDPASLGRAAQWLWYAGLLAVLLAVSTLTWRWIEEPARQISKRFFFEKKNQKTFG